MEHDDFEEPDVDSDFDYEDNKKKKKRAMAKSTPKVWKSSSSFNIQFALLHDGLVLKSNIFKQKQKKILLLS